MNLFRLWILLWLFTLTHITVPCHATAERQQGMQDDNETVADQYLVYFDDEYPLDLLHTVTSHIFPLCQSQCQSQNSSQAATATETNITAITPLFDQEGVTSHPNPVFCIQFPHRERWHSSKLCHVNTTTSTTPTSRFALISVSQHINQDETNHLSSSPPRNTLNRIEWLKRVASHQPSLHSGGLPGIKSSPTVVDIYPNRVLTISPQSRTRPQFERQPERRRDEETAPINGHLSMSTESTHQHHSSTHYTPLSFFYQQNITASRINIGIFDTGVASQNENVVEVTDWTPDKDGIDYVGHGSLISGLLSSTHPYCPGVTLGRLYIFKVFDRRQQSTTAGFLDALGYAATLHLDIANLSLGGPDFNDMPFIAAVNTLISRGVVVVSAVGNDGPIYGSLTNPSDLASVISIGSYSRRRTRISSQPGGGISGGSGASSPRYNSLELYAFPDTTNDHLLGGGEDRKHASDAANTLKNKLYISFPTGIHIDPSTMSPHDYYPNDHNDQQMVNISTYHDMISSLYVSPFSSRGPPLYSMSVGTGIAKPDFLMPGDALLAPGPLPHHSQAGGLKENSLPEREHHKYGRCEPITGTSASAPIGTGLFALGMDYAQSILRHAPYHIESNTMMMMTTTPEQHMPMDNINTDSHQRDNPVNVNVTKRYIPLRRIISPHGWKALLHQSTVQLPAKTAALSIYDQGGGIVNVDHFAEMIRQYIQQWYELYIQRLGGHGEHGGQNHGQSNTPLQQPPKRDHHSADEPETHPSSIPPSPSSSQPSLVPPHHTPLPYAIRLYPQHINTLDCPYQWPHCSLPLYSSQLASVHNITVISPQPNVDLVQATYTIASLELYENTTDSIHARRPTGPSRRKSSDDIPYDLHNTFAHCMGKDCDLTPPVLISIGKHFGHISGDHISFANDRHTTHDGAMSLRFVVPYDVKIPFILSGVIHFQFTTTNIDPRSPISETTTVIAEHTATPHIREIDHSMMYHIPIANHANFHFPHNTTTTTTHVEPGVLQDHPGKTSQMVELPFRVLIIPTPPRSHRVLFDVYYNTYYPFVYTPQDAELSTSSIDRHGDSPYTNLREMYQYLRNAGYFIELNTMAFSCFKHDLHSPTTRRNRQTAGSFDGFTAGDCSNAYNSHHITLHNYGSLVLYDNELALLPSDMQTIRYHVDHHGLGLVIVAEWDHPEARRQMRFYDHNTNKIWAPHTGGSNLFAINQLLAPYNISLTTHIYSSSQASQIAGVSVPVRTSSAIARWPANGNLYFAPDVYDITPSNMYERRLQRRIIRSFETIHEIEQHLQQQTSPMSGRDDVQRDGDEHSVISIQTLSILERFTLLPPGQPSEHSQKTDKKKKKPLLTSPVTKIPRIPILGTFDTKYHNQPRSHDERGDDGQPQFDGSSKHGRIAVLTDTHCVDTALRKGSHCLALLLKIIQHVTMMHLEGEDGDQNRQDPLETPQAFCHGLSSCHQMKTGDMDTVRESQDRRGHAHEHDKLSPLAEQLILSLLHYQQQQQQQLSSSSSSSSFAQYPSFPVPYELVMPQKLPLAVHLVTSYSAFHNILSPTIVLALSLYHDIHALYTTHPHLFSKTTPLPQDNTTKMHIDSTLAAMPVVIFDLGLPQCQPFTSPSLQQAIMALWHDVLVYTNQHNQDKMDRNESNNHPISYTSFARYFQQTIQDNPPLQLTNDQFFAQFCSSTFASPSVSLPTMGNMVPSPLQLTRKPFSDNPEELLYMYIDMNRKQNGEQHHHLGQGREVVYGQIQSLIEVNIDQKHHENSHNMAPNNNNGGDRRMGLELDELLHITYDLIYNTQNAYHIHDFNTISEPLSVVHLE